MSQRGRPARRHAAVGAVVADGQARVLLLERDVLRDGAWVREVRLPKGSLQPEETDAAAALAEARRSTGYLRLEVLADLGRAPVEYVHRNVQYRRQEHFFLLQLVSDERRSDDPDEARLSTVTFAASFDEALARLSFPSEQEAVLRAKAWWPTS